MGLFKAYQRDTDSTESQQAESGAAGVEADATAAPVKKKVPTPTRRQAEQARRERLNPTLNPKQARIAEREARNTQRTESLRKQEADPSRQLVRNYLDSQRTFAQWTMPVIMLCLAASVAVQYINVGYATYVAIVTWIILIATAVDCVRLWAGFKKLHQERYPNASRKGLASYMVNRSINIRRLRQPPPAVKIGEEI